MPKVSNEYFNTKKEMIINAAFAVFKSKPIYQAEMKDIIKESGLSQGGIYRYYAGIDEILIEVINRSNPGGDYKQKIDGIIAGSKTLTAAIGALFGFLGNYMMETESVVGKFQFELTVMYTSQPERAMKILSGIADGQSGKYFMSRLLSLIENGIASGYFRPALPTDDIYSFISASIDGIVLNLVLNKIYTDSSAGNTDYNAANLMKVLSESILGLLCPVMQKEAGKDE